MQGCIHYALSDLKTCVCQRGEIHARQCGNARQKVRMEPVFFTFFSVAFLCLGPCTVPDTSLQQSFVWKTWHESNCIFWLLPSMHCALLAKNLEQIIIGQTKLSIFVGYHSEPQLFCYRCMVLDTSLQQSFVWGNLHQVGFHEEVFAHVHQTRPSLQVCRSITNIMNNTSQSSLLLLKINPPPPKENRDSYEKNAPYKSSSTIRLHGRLT